MSLLGKTPPTHSLANLFASKTVLDVLAVLLLNPGRDLYQRELVDKAACTVLQAQRALRRIEGAGLLTKQRRGNRVYYTANRQHPAFEDLRRVMLKTVGLGDALREALQPVRERIAIAFIFGSVAAGSESPSSDIDLLLIGDLSSRQTAKILGPVGRDMGRELNTVLYPPSEFRQKARRGNRFVLEVLSGPKIWLMGSEDDLARITG